MRPKEEIASISDPSDLIEILHGLDHEGCASLLTQIGSKQLNEMISSRDTLADMLKAMPEAAYVAFVAKLDPELLKTMITNTEELSSVLMRVPNARCASFLARLGDERLNEIVSVGDSANFKNLTHIVREKAANLEIFPLLTTQGLVESTWEKSQRSQNFFTPNNNVEVYLAAWKAENNQDRFAKLSTYVNDPNNKRQPFCRDLIELYGKEVFAAAKDIEAKQAPAIPNKSENARDPDKENVTLRNIRHTLTKNPGGAIVQNQTAKPEEPAIKSEKAVVAKIDGEGDGPPQPGRRR